MNKDKRIWIIRWGITAIFYICLFGYSIYYSIPKWQFGVISYAYILLFILSCVLEWKYKTRDMTKDEKDKILHEISSEYSRKPSLDGFMKVYYAVMIFLAVVVFLYVTFFLLD